MATVILQPGEQVTICFADTDGIISVGFDYQGSRAIQVHSELSDSHGRSGIIYEEKFGIDRNKIEILYKTFTWEDVRQSWGCPEINDTNMFKPLEIPDPIRLVSDPGFPIKCIFNEEEEVTAYVGMSTNGFGLTILCYDDARGVRIGTEPQE